MQIIQPAIADEHIRRSEPELDANCISPFFFTDSREDWIADRVSHPADKKSPGIPPGIPGLNNQGASTITFF